MVVVPGLTAVTTPVAETVATVVLEEVQGVVAAGVPEPVRVIVALSHTAVGPVIVGWAFTVTVTVALHPLLLVYVMVVVPAPTPVTTPALLMVATAVLEEVQGVVAAGVPDPFRVMVAPIHTAVGPVIVGLALTVIVVVVEHPLLLVKVIVTVPAATPVTTPALLTVAMPVLEEAQGFTAAGVPEPDKLIVDPTQTGAAPEMTGTTFTVMVVVVEHPLLLV